MKYKKISSLLEDIGKNVLATLAALGRIVLFTLGTFRHIISGPFYLRELWIALVQVGWLSLPVVGLTAFFTGGALALQIYAGGARFNAESVVPSIVAIGMTRELGPVLGGLMVAARVASSVAAEIATMKVTEQIDALVTLSTNPMKYLTVPRVVAATLSVPLLVAVGDAIGIMGGYIVGISRLGLVKGAVFGFIVALMGCYYGMNSGNGAQGVGAATKSAVVAASILILAANYFLTEVFFRA